MGLLLNATNRVLGRKVKADRAAVVLHESVALPLLVRAAAADRLCPTIPTPCPSPGPSLPWRREGAGSPPGGGSWSCRSGFGPPGAQPPTVRRTFPQPCRS